MILTRDETETGKLASSPHGNLQKVDILQFCITMPLKIVMLVERKSFEVLAELNDKVWAVDTTAGGVVGT